MKKFFTLAVAAVMTMSASAGVIYSWESKGPDAVTEVGGKATGMVDAGRVNYVNTAKGVTYYTICLSGKKKDYPKSAYVNVALDQPLAAGDVISVTAFRNKDAMGKNVTIEFIFGENVATVSSTEQFPNLNEAGENDPAPATQTFIVPDAAAGCTFFDMTRGSAATNLFINKLEITREGSEETPVEGETFSVYGNGANTFGQTFDDVVMPFEFNSATKVVKMTNFLGSSATVEYKYELTDVNADPNMVGTMFNSVGVSGFGDGDENSGYVIDGFTGAFVIKKDGADFGKIENVKFMLGYWSQLAVEAESEGEGVAAKKVYKLTFMVGGDFYPWDAATSSWGKKADYPEFIKFEKTLPFSNETSAIESIGADDENAPVEYFNIQGMRVSEPAAGQLLIRRQGSKVSKVIIR